jgi:hypothetical protein
MIQFRIQGKDKNHLVQIPRGQSIDIIEELEILGMDVELWFLEIEANGLTFTEYAELPLRTIDGDARTLPRT